MGTTRQIFHITLTAFLTMCSIVSFAQKSPFTTVLQSNHSICINKQIKDCDTIDLIQEEIKGLSLDGVIIQNGTNSFLRVVLEDCDGNNYLIINANRMLFPSDSIVLHNYSEDGAYLNNTKPKCLKIYAHNSTLTLKTVNFVNIESKQRATTSSINEDSIRRCQVELTVKKINEYNALNNKLWVAGVTKLSLEDYETRKRILGVCDKCSTGGIEYYAGGIFDVGERALSTPKTSSSQAVSQCVNSFDWRNRHGKNWMTSVKNQLNSGYCVAFAICSMLEARVNLYYNQLINIDLSEQDIVNNYAKHTGKSIRNIYNSGMNSATSLRYVVNDGVIDEVSEPFVDSPNAIIPTSRNFNELIRIQSFSSITPSINTIDSIKKTLICNGPAESGIITCPHSAQTSHSKIHSMSLVGYHTIQVGDSILQVKTDAEGGLFRSKVISESDVGFIGKTYWVFKDNYGEDLPGRDAGYFYAFFNNYDCMRNVCYTSSSIESTEHSDSDIAITDEDGDGYYFWGIGPRPSHCPDWIPNTPDGDDSDYTKGPMDEYGNLKELNPALEDTIYIDSDSICTRRKYIYNNTIIRNGGSLTLQGQTTFYRNVALTILSGGTLIVDAAIVENAKICVQEGATLRIINNGVVKICEGDNFIVPLCSTLELVQGEICH